MCNGAWENNCRRNRRQKMATEGTFKATQEVPNESVVALCGASKDHGLKKSCSISDSKDQAHILQDALQYRIDESPSWGLCVFLGLQHYLTMFGSTIAVPILLAPYFCISDKPLILGEIISTIFFVSGIATLLQTFFGTRLPIVQGATFSFLGPAMVILSFPEFKCPVDGNSVNNTTHDWRVGMREVQGAIMVSSLFQIFLGFSGLVGLIVKIIGPLTIAPTISLIGLSLFSAAGYYSGKQWGISCLTAFLTILFSQVLKEKKIPLPWINSEKRITLIWLPLFKLFPILLSIVLSWAVCAIVTAADGFSSNPKHLSFAARTDSRIDVLKNSDWFRIPYPGQWGTPTVSLASVFGMLAGVLASIIESVGDYYACARLSGAPPPPQHAISRGIAIEGIGCLIAGALGSGNGTTSYGENIAAVGITKVGSRRVIQLGAVFMLVLSVFGKFGALFATVPDPILGGMFWVLFGMILAVGLSNLQHVDLNSSRNLFVLGFSFFTGMMIPDWFAKNPNAIDTGVKEIDQIIVVLLKTNMAVGCVVAMLFDNILPGTDEERGLLGWRSKGEAAQKHSSSIASIHVYDPICTKFWVGRKWLKFVPFLPYYPNKCEVAYGDIELEPTNTNAITNNSSLMP